MTNTELKIYRIQKKVKLCEISKETKINNGILSNIENGYRDCTNEQEKLILRAIEKISNSLRSEL